MNHRRSGAKKFSVPFCLFAFMMVLEEAIRSANDTDYGLSGLHFFG